MHLLLLEMAIIERLAVVGAICIVTLMVLPPDKRLAVSLPSIRRNIKHPSEQTSHLMDCGFYANCGGCPKGLGIGCFD